MYMDVRDTTSYHTFKQTKLLSKQHTGLTYSTLQSRTTVFFCCIISLCNCLSLHYTKPIYIYTFCLFAIPLLPLANIHIIVENNNTQTPIIA